MKQSIERQLRKFPSSEIDQYISKKILIQCNQLLHALIETPSMSGEEADTANLIYDFFVENGVQPCRLFNNVWAFNKYFSRDKPTLLLNSHHDTVKPNSAYTMDPYKAVRKQGKIFGLGSNDAGGALVSLIAAFLSFFNQQDLPFNICIAATAEEENSGNKGLVSILSRLGKLDFAIVGEPTLLKVAIAEKGNMVVDCDSYGIAGHSARADGENAIYKALEDLLWFRQFNFSKICPYLGKTTMNVTQISGGFQANVIPEKCKFTVDIRFTSKYKSDEIFEIIKEHVKCSINVRPGVLDSSSISPDHILVKAAMHLGLEMFASPTCSDQGWLSIPSIKFGPGNSLRSHIADEFIYESEFIAGIVGYINLLKALELFTATELPEKSKITI